MQNILKLQKKIVPELVDVLEKRYQILRTIYYKQPIGRRILANGLNLGERVVRSEITFLKNQGLIDVNTPGMTITALGVEIVEGLSGFIHELKGLSDIEDALKELLNVEKVIIVPGDLEENPTVIKDLGKASANYLRKIIASNNIIALTGGSTIKEVVEAFPHTNDFSNILVLPARGGMGRNVETQANTLAASLAKKVNGTYKMLHIPDNISIQALETLTKEKEISSIIENINKANIIIYGIGDALMMAKKRGIPEDNIDKLNSLGAVGEAFGCYFDKNGNLLEETNAVGSNILKRREVSTHIAVAGGKNKVESIISTQLNDRKSIVVTDEAAAIKMLQILKERSN